ncbi:hypothetical protein NITGR_270037 [Nitrospina gracilis 3/211]|uniref:Uncharacterized protein n=1 Tax=Nitrospina gracilis (strain 3/211) TaxID=1266370 RepID=M1YXS1_NITG3|nr:hypothetical protein NITGR_270037 [Nitrospina gracilis 3/211]
MAVRVSHLTANLHYNVCITTKFNFGAVAQLGARLNRTQEVGGSNPPSSTFLKGLEEGLVSFQNQHAPAG